MVFCCRSLTNNPSRTSSSSFRVRKSSKACLIRLVRLIDVVAMVSIASSSIRLSECGFGRGRGDWVLGVVLLLQATEIYVLCKNFMYTGLPPVPGCPCRCRCSYPLPLFLVPAGPLVVPSGLSGLSFMTVLPLLCTELLRGLGLLRSDADGRFGWRW